MASCLGSMWRGARALGRRPVALVFGASVVSAGVWIAQSEWRRQHRVASVGGAGGVAGDGPGDPARGLYTGGSLSTADSTDAEPSLRREAFVPRLLLSAGACMIPHPDKMDKGGEDAFFVSAKGCCLGVADGVGGWAEIGVDPGLYSKELMRLASEAAATCTPGPHTPQQLLEIAYYATRARGSSTACILCLENERLHASNLGDSGFMVVRDGELHFLSPQQQHEFNFPYQIGEPGAGRGAALAGGSPDSMADTPKAAQRFTVDVREGDIVVAATDGLFDNVYPDEAAQLVTAARAAGDSAQVAAAALAQFGRIRAEDRSHLSPFAYSAQQLGYKYFGGKLDDVTVVCAYVEKTPAAKL
eukprot:scaffold16.g20.t1